MKWRLFAVAATAILPPLISLGYNEFSIRQSYVATVYEAALRNARQAKFEVEQVIDEVGAILFVTSTMRSVAVQHGAACQATFAEILAGTAALKSMTLIGLNGRVLCSSASFEPDTSFIGIDYFKRAIELNARAVGTLQRAVDTDEFVLPIAVPVHIGPGKTTSVLMAEMKMSWLDEHIRDRGIAKGAALSIADSNGYVIARIPDPQHFVGKRFPDQFLQIVNATEPGTIVATSRDGIRRIFGYVPPASSASGLYVGAGISEAEAFAFVNRMTVSTIVAIIAGLGLGLLSAWTIGSRFIVHPVRRILATVAAWRAGDTTARTGLSALPHGEIGTIGVALDEFMREIEDARQQTERTAQYRDLLMRELGHRVKNTLAIAVSMANQMFRNSPDERDAFTQRLMALAGAYDLLLTDNWTSASLAAVVEKTLQPHLTTPEQLRTVGPVVDLPSALVLALSLVLHELATNAVKYGALARPAGRLTIAWTATSQSTAPEPGDGPAPPPSIAVNLTWVERGGPSVTPPTRQGFGSKLLNRAFQAEYRSTIALDYAEDGLTARISFIVPPKSGTSGDLLP